MHPIHPPSLNLHPEKPVIQHMSSYRTGFIDHTHTDSQIKFHIHNGGIIRPKCDQCAHRRCRYSPTIISSAWRIKTRSARCVYKQNVYAPIGGAQVCHQSSTVGTSAVGEMSFWQLLIPRSHSMVYWSGVGGCCESVTGVGRLSGRV